MFKLDRNSTVFVVDDDLAARDSVTSMVRIMGLRTKSFQTAEDFLSENLLDQPGCLVADLRMPGMSGIALLQTLRESGSSLQVMLVTAYADVTVAVDAMRRGAMTILEKPYRPQVLWDFIVRALQQDQQQRAAAARSTQIMDRIRRLNELEASILEMIVNDLPNKSIAGHLHISTRTVDHRRAEILAKLGMDNVKSLIWHLGAAGWPTAFDSISAH